MAAWVIGNSVVSPLGLTSEENYSMLAQHHSGIARVHDSAISSLPLMASQIKGFNSQEGETRFEALCLLAAQVALNNLVLDADRTLYILSSTKGNISLLEQGIQHHPRLHLHAAAKWLASRSGFHHAIVVSNACISGVLALIVGKRFLDSGKYENVVIVGADVLSHFVVSGFQSLHALSEELCQPFDQNRHGINLGEAAAAVVLSSNPGKVKDNCAIKIAGGGVSNDANHISGPSRTGEELGLAISQALQAAEKDPDEIDFISAHGTATLFNDEMEAKAFHRAGLGDVPLNSLKGYFGHTLGAAGIVETAMSMHSLRNNQILATKGFEKLGVSQDLRVSARNISGSVSTCLKTASGFGGCNAALVLQKEKNI